MVRPLKLLVVGITTALAAANPVEAADQLTAGELLEFCSSADPTLKASCRFFILGIVEGVSSADGTTLKDNQFQEGKKTILCVPEGVSISTLVDVAQTVLRGVFQLYPDDRKLPASASVMALMSQRYPCR